jgi:multiple antibiotic resistance protein
MQHLTLVSTYVGLVTIANPLGSIPIFLYLTEGRTDARRRRIALGVGVTVTITLAVALAFGDDLLRVFDIGLPAFRLAGAFVIAAVAWGMLAAKPSSVLASGAQEDRSITVVPLAIPVLTGPGAISLAIAYGDDADTTGEEALGFGVVALVAVTVTLALLAAPTIARVLRPTGLDVVTRLFGLILLALATDAGIRMVGRVFPGLLGGLAGALP